MKLLKTEAQILDKWTVQFPPLVSVIGIIYNQEPYLIDTLEGFLSQETDFPFEIILHDDASNDATVEIIMRYAKLYPALIKPILQKVNQFSQGINPVLIAVSHAQGKYIALCEGDDYWIDSQKLQFQIDAMQQNPACKISFHPSLQKYILRNQPDKFIAQHSNFQKVFSASEVILGSAGFCPTSSLIMSKNIFDTLPDWFYNLLSGDYFLQIFGALNAGAIYINRVMSVYRIKSVGSWTNRVESDPEFAYDYFVKILKTLEEADIYTKNKYHREFNTIKRKASFLMCRTPLLPLAQRKAFYLQYNGVFRLREKTMWYLCYNNWTVCRWLYKLEQQIRK